jgi:hypothetical protein
MSLNLAGPKSNESEGGLGDTAMSPVRGDAGQHRDSVSATGGVGIMFGTDPLSEGFHVTRVFEGSPAEKDGRIQVCCSNLS